MKTTSTQLVILLLALFTGKTINQISQSIFSTVKVKSYFLLIVTLMALSFTNVNAQCTLLNPGIKLNSSVPQSGGGCLINVDLSFDLTHNNGNKWVNIHIWPTSSYPSLSYAHAPKQADLSADVANIIIDQRAVPLVLSSSYIPDGTVPVEAAGLTLNRIDGVAFDTYTISNVTLFVATGCNVAQSFTGDVWSSQSSMDGVVHCVTSGVSFIANDPKAVGSILCNNPRQYSLTITTISTTTLTGTYNVYRDNGDGILDVNVDALVSSNVPWSADDATPYQSGAQSYAGNNTNPESNQPLFAVVSTVGLQNTIITRMDNGCGPLPVVLSNFYTARKNNSVVLNWKTETETNVAKFEIQKKVGSDFETVAYVNANNSANGGTYTYTDINSSSSITEYRLKIVDKSGNIRFSDIRSVKGVHSTNDFTIYPNPSNGITKIMISDISDPISINLIDNSGRVVKTINSTSSSTLEINGLQKGIYLVRLVNQTSGETVIKKLIVNK